MYADIEFHNGIKLSLPEKTFIKQEIGLGERYKFKLTPQEYIDNPIGIRMESIDIENLIVVKIELNEGWRY